MSTETLFQLSFALAAPFWALMILAPRWRWTERLVSSPWIAAVPLLAYLPIALPHMGELWTVVSQPDLGTLRAFAGTDYGAASLWAHLVAFDLFIGRWMYHDSRSRGLHPLLVGPVLLLTILLSAVGFLTYLALRLITTRTYRAGKRGVHQRETARSG